VNAAEETIRVEPADGGRTFEHFLKLPYRIYAHDPNWVAPLLRDVRTMFDRAKHPFHEHSEVQPFVAYRGRRPVGRITAIHNRNHVAFHEEPVGFFGFFESIDDPAVAAALFERAAEWLRERGLETMRGPTDFSTNEVCGLLVEGFDSPPAIMMPYQPACYEPLLLDAGFTVAKTLLAYHLTNNVPPAMLLARAERLAERLQVRLRTLRMGEFEVELDRVRDIYNRSWEKNWGFVPMTDAEIRFMAQELKPIVARDPEQVVFAETLEGEPIGFALWLKDYNQALIHARGRLFPFGLLKILWHARRIDFCRVLTLGLVPEYRGKGIDNLLYLAIFREGAAKGMQAGEFSWILEDNLPMRKPLERIGATVYKRYRLYDRPV
jgi:GNAT superfamily N-acetyltransferase